ncbi:MAG: hypothetical protein HUK08_09875, partial [Bacteroidaceae bacterium]|nr:hypothetical protein [Bacteroidaceae bacterium]
FDVVEDIYRIFHIDRMADDAAFVSAFFDYLKNFAAQNTATIRNFLKQWDEVISDKAIETEATDGVQMMTIHKSKGLEFHNVIIADGNWSTKVDQNRIWVEIGEPPFNDIPFAKLRPSKQLENSIFEEEYREECMQNDVDNINLLYVAFTRAGKNLYYYGQTSKKKEGLNNELPPKEYLKGGMSGVVEQTVLTATLDDGSGILHAPTHTYIYDEEGNTCGYTLHYGDFAINEKKKAKKKNDRVNVFDMAVSPLTVPIHTSTSRAVFLQSNRSRQFVDEDDATSYISIGKLMHNVLSQIITLDDVDRVLTSLEHEGVITDRNLSVLLRRRIMESEHAQQWFAEGWTVYNECAILTAEGEKRPDRVITDGTRTIVIDYKFGNQKDEYREQVTAYKHLLEQIGMPNVSAYLWYVYTDTVVNV